MNLRQSTQQKRFDRTGKWKCLIDTRVKPEYDELVGIDCLCSFQHPVISSPLSSLRRQGSRPEVHQAQSAAVCGCSRLDPGLNPG